MNEYSSAVFFQFKDMISKFLLQETSAELFVNSYVSRFKVIGPVDEELFKLLNYLFFRANDYTSDPGLLTPSNPGFINEWQLRQEAWRTLNMLEELQSRSPHRPAPKPSPLHGPKS